MDLEASQDCLRENLKPYLSCALLGPEIALVAKPGVVRISRQKVQAGAYTSSRVSRGLTLPWLGLELNLPCLRLAYLAIDLDTAWSGLGPIDDSQADHPGAAIFECVGHVNGVQKHSLFSCGSHKNRRARRGVLSNER